MNINKYSITVTDCYIINTLQLPVQVKASPPSGNIMYEMEVTMITKHLRTYFL